MDFSLIVVRPSNHTVLIVSGWYQDSFRISFGYFMDIIRIVSDTNKQGKRQDFLHEHERDNISMYIIALAGS